MDSVGHVADGDFVLRPARKQGPKEMTADLPVQAAYPIDRPAAPDCQVGHVEGLRRVVRVLPAESQQIVKGNAEPLFGIPPKVLLDEGRSESVKTGGHCGVRGEEVSCSRGLQCDLEGLSGFFHETAGTFQHGERCMSFIQVTDFRFDSERAEQSPSANPEQQFLLESQLGAAPIEFAGNAAMSGKVRRIIAVQQVKLHSADLYLPAAQPDRVTR